MPFSLLITLFFIFNAILPSSLGLLLLIPGDDKKTQLPFFDPDIRRSVQPLP